MKKILSSISIFSLAASVHATDISLPAQTISTIQTGYGGEGIYLELHEGIKAAGCNSGQYLIPKQNNPMYNDLLSLSLSAFHAKTKVILRVTNCLTANDFSLNVVAIKLTE